MYAQGNSFFSHSFIPIIAQLAHEDNNYIEIWSLCMGLAKWISTHQGHLAKVIAEYPTCQEQRSTLSP